MEERNGMPSFDFSHYSRKQQQTARMMGLRLSRLGKQIDQRASEMSDEEHERVLNEIETLRESMSELVFRQVSYVPRDWFVVEAPDGISCDTPQWWEWLRADKEDILSQMAREASSPEEVSGN